MEMKNLIIILALMPFSLFGQQTPPIDTINLEGYKVMLNTLSREELINAAAKAMCQTDRILRVAMSQDDIIDSKDKTISTQKERLKIQESEIESLRRTIKSLDIVVSKQVEEIQSLKNKKQ